MQRTDATELLDREAERVPAAELAGNLRDIRRANRYFGGTRAVLRAIEPVMAGAGDGNDDDPGPGDRIGRYPAGHRARCSAQGCTGARAGDRSATERAGRGASGRAVGCGCGRAGRCAGLALRGRTRSISSVLSLALHHFGPDEAAQVLSEMRRVGRRLLVVNDLERSRAGYVGAWLVGHCLTRNRLTRHDAPLSVRRAYTRAEALALARGRAGGSRACAPSPPFAMC